MIISWLLAWRFLRSSHQENTISLMIKVCFLSICIGTFALTLILAIANGFEKATYDKLQGVHSDIIMQAGGQELDYKKIARLLEQEFKEAVSAYSPLSSGPVLLKNMHSDATVLAELKGIDPVGEQQVSKIGSMISDKKPDVDPWQELANSNTIFIGELLAGQLGVKVGDSIMLLLQPDEIQSNKITLVQHEAKIAALFKTGINEYDEHIAFCSLSFFNNLFETGITQITAKLAPGADGPKTINALKKRLNITVFSWKDLYPAIVSAMALEKYAMTIILALIALIASMNIISLLFMYVTQKQKDIAILKALGTGNTTIMAIFIILGLIISASAATTGIIGAAIADYFLRHYPIIQLPDVYYATHVPSELTLNLILIVALAVIILSFLAMLLPIVKTKNISVTNTLKAE